jgi:uncharacterized protein
VVRFSLKSIQRLIILLAIIVVIPVTVGCSSLSTSTSQYKGTDEKLALRDYDTAIKQIEAAKDKQYKEKDKVLYFLDLGMLYHYDQQYAKSNELLTQAENSIEDLYTKSISRAALSLMLNDNVLEYSGEDYEDIYVNVFKALNYLELNQFDEAFVEIRRINLKLSVLEDKYKKLADELNKSPDKKIEITAGTNKFYNDALGRYLSMLLYRTEGKLDDARIDYNKIQEAFVLEKNIYSFQQPDLSKSLEYENGKAKVNIISFIGKSPVKKPFDVFVTTIKDAIVFTGTKPGFFMAPIPWPGLEEGYHFRFSVPYITEDTPKISKVKIVVDDGIAYELSKLEDIYTVADETFNVKKPVIYIKSLTRSVVKGVAAQKQKKKLEANNPGLAGKLMSWGTSAAVDLTENADLRISRFFPGDAMILELDLTPGHHFFKVNYYDEKGVIIHSENLGEKDIKPDGLNLLETVYIH